MSFKLSQDKLKIISQDDWDIVEHDGELYQDNNGFTINAEGSTTPYTTIVIAGGDFEITMLDRVTGKTITLSINVDLGGINISASEHQLDHRTKRKTKTVRVKPKDFTHPSKYVTRFSCKYKKLVFDNK